ncbi:hypothetical protein CERZMDRAFT_90821 [Cercospora zeae-maydis SCOH1-5]|uniref:Uncharacterized protein n=1 Tax=Cercospora zeae-maydis SCOH1-5 TaxID=717836 RepID=A0A6A6FF20_9PEZI|nr:hypothetical protein CERZMDRAFT_90821 [Cercospora zeae-maydis SCOH1-5]
MGERKNAQATCTNVVHCMLDVARSTNVSWHLIRPAACDLARIRSKVGLSAIANFVPHSRRVDTVPRGSFRRDTPAFSMLP